MIVNMEKTRYQLFSMRNNCRKFNLFYNNQLVTETTNQRYLGVVLDQRLTFKFNITEVIEKLQKRLRILKRLAGPNWGTSKDTPR